MRQIIFTLTFSLLLISCGQNETKQKELELKERELTIKEKKLAIKGKESNLTSDTLNLNAALNQTNQIDINNIPIAKFPLTKAADVRKVHPNCNEANTPHVEGYAPLVDMYCGVLGQKTIEIYITSQNESTKIVTGYSVVGNSRTNFEGKYTSRIKKGLNRKDVLDFDETIYTLILREPTTSNKNGVFKLDFHINDT